MTLLDMVRDYQSLLERKEELVTGRGHQPFFFVEADVGAGNSTLFRSLFDVHLLHLRPYTTP